MLGNRNSQHSFAQIPAVNMARSSFDRSHTIKDTFNFDYLVPIFVDEILPGDTHNLRAQTFARLATQKVPIMDNMYVDYFFFFVPSRILWDNWEKFNGAQDSPGDSTDFIVPRIGYIAAADNAVGSIWDKFGVPTGIDKHADQQLIALPFRAYNLIWNTWFRDQNLQTPAWFNKGNGPESFSYFQLRKRGKRHDYFTSCLPWPQKGPAVQIPLGDYAPVIGIGKFNSTFPSTNFTYRESDGTSRQYASYTNMAGGGSDNAFGVEQNPNAAGYPFIRADLSEATAATINQFREAFMMQSLFELDARGGTRYVEILQSHFNVTSPDFRLQRPEFLGGGSSKINSHIVPQTSPTAGADAQAQLAAFATTRGENIGFSKSFVEHGYVIGLACARADITYQQGLNRMWTRETRYDYFWPKLQELGEQAVLMQEIYFRATPADNKLPFGYQERYAEYRYKPSEIRGEFRSTFAQSLDFWHMAEEFGTAPSLNAAFIEQSTPIARAIAVPSAPHLLFDCFFKLTSVRPMKTYSVPAGLGRF